MVDHAPSRPYDPSSGDQEAQRVPARRYTVRFRLEPTGDSVEYRAVTPTGEFMAVAMATARLLQKNPGARISAVEVTNVENEFTLDPAEDALDYWGLN